MRAKSGLVLTIAGLLAAGSPFLWMSVAWSIKGNQSVIRVPKKNSIGSVSDFQTDVTPDAGLEQ